MTIANELTKLNTNLTNSYTAVSDKGGTLPQAQNFDNLATAISSIPSGGVGITREVSAQGVYQMPISNFTFSLPSNATSVGLAALQYAFQNCTGLTSVDLSSLTSLNEEKCLASAFQNCTNLTSVDLSSLSTFGGGNYGLQSAFNGCTSLTSVDLSSLTTIDNGSNNMDNTFSRCTSLTNLDLSSLTSIKSNGALGSAFYGCTKLISADFSGLMEMDGENTMFSAFSGCSNLESINFNNLQHIGTNTSSSVYANFRQCFQNCTKLTSIYFPKLEKIYCKNTNSLFGTFSYCNKIQKLYFPKLDTITYPDGASTSNQTACKNIFYSCSSLTELHFGAANQAAIEASLGYSTAWGRGAGNVTIYFDL